MFLWSCSSSVLGESVEEITEGISFHSSPFPFSFILCLCLQSFFLSAFELEVTELVEQCLHAILPLLVPSYHTDIQILSMLLWSKTCYYDQKLLMIYIWYLSRRWVLEWLVQICKPISWCLKCLSISLPAEHRMCTSLRMRVSPKAGDSVHEFVASEGGRFWEGRYAKGACCLGQEQWETLGHWTVCHLRCLPQVCVCCVSYNNVVNDSLLVTSGSVGFKFLLLFWTWT